MMLETGLNFADGSLNISEPRIASTPIYVSPGDVLKTNFVGTGNMWNFYVIYNASGEKIIHSGLNDDGTITMPNNAAYIRLGITSPQSATVTNTTTGEVLFKWSLNQ